MAENNLEQWVKASYMWTGFEFEFLLIIQSLGRINYRLHEQELYHHSLTEAQRAELHNVPVLDDIFGSSRLWIFGCFELIRTLEKYSKEYRGNERIVTDLNRLKRKALQIRSPLAKFQVMGKNQTSIARSILTADGLAGWVLHDGKIITRQEIAKDTLEVLLSLKPLIKA